MSKQTITVDFHGIPFTVTGRYYGPEPDVNAGPTFEIISVKAGVVIAGLYRDEELAGDGVDSSAWDFLESEALEQIEAGFEAAAEEAADARREARRDAERE